MFGQVPLSRRVVLANTVLVLTATAVLALSPATKSHPITTIEGITLVVGTGLVLALNVVLMRRLFSPLRRLSDLMREIDPLAPGARLHARADPEVQVLADSFNAMLDRLEFERRDSARRALNAQEAERARIARELHDEVGQALTAVVLGIERVEREPSPELVGELRDVARESLSSVRRIVRELRPEALEDLGLGSALNALATGLLRDARVDVERRVNGVADWLTPEQELVIYRVAQEALTNVARHANAGRVVIELREQAPGVVLMVSDDGRGFSGRPSTGGLRGMRERSVLIDARLDIRSRPGHGTEIRLEVPSP